MTSRDQALREQREQTVRSHMEAKNVHDFDTVIGSFGHPRYELIGSDSVHDGEQAIREYFRETRTAFPDQRNELIALQHADDALHCPIGAVSSVRCSRSCAWRACFESG